MQNIYIIRTKDNRLHCFYHTQESGINMRTYENGGWSKSINIVPDARRNYTVSLSAGRFHIFCSDPKGNISLCTGKAGSDAWDMRLILSNQSKTSHYSLFNAIAAKDGFRLIYNIPSGEDRSQFIMSQQLYENGEWGTPSRLDKISLFSENIFITQQTGPEHLLLFYQAKNPEPSLGYREITPERIGSFNVIHAAANQLSDASFLTATDSIHAVYVVRNIFTSQLLYKKRDSHGLSTSTVVWNGPIIENCSIFFIKNILHISFISNGVLYIAKSEDYGYSFSKPEKYEGGFCNAPVKAFYISENIMHEDHYFLREVYVNKNNPFDIQIIPNLIRGFLPTIYTTAYSFKEKAAQESAPEINPDRLGGYQTDIYDPFADMTGFAASTAKAGAPVSNTNGLNAEVYNPFPMDPSQAFAQNWPRSASKELNAIADLKTSLSASLERNSHFERKLSELNRLIFNKNKEIKDLKKILSETQKSFEERINNYVAEIEKLHDIKPIPNSGGNDMEK